MAQNNTVTNRVERDARLRWVPIPQMKVSPLAQRELNQSRVDHMAANFDPEMIGTPTVNLRDGHFYIIDGQHRVEMMKQIGWGDQNLQCWTYENLTEQEEAERFLKLSDTLTIDAFAKFRVGITAGRETEIDIDRVVRLQNLVVSKDQIPGAISAVGTLRRVYGRAGAKTLGRALRIVRDSYGDAGLSAEVIGGIGLLCQRYNGELDDTAAVAKLSSVHGGVHGLTNQARNLRLKTGNQLEHCVAAAAVELINRGKGGRKLPDWWKQ